MHVIAFQTARLIIRQLRDDDAPTLASYRSDPQVARFLSWAMPYSQQRASELINRHLGRDFDHPGESGLNLAVVRTDTQELIGDAHIRHEGNDPRQGVIGYVFAREVHGNGYATELARGMIARFFSTPAAHRIAAYCDARNTARARVLEKAGMRHEATFVQGAFARDRWVDEHAYGLLRSEWLRQQSHEHLPAPACRKCQSARNAAFAADAPVLG